MLKTKKNIIKVLFSYWLLSVIFTLSSDLFSDDASARVAFDEAIKKEQSQDYASAGSKYMDAAFLADDRALKINALQNAAANFKRAKLLYKEFTAIEKLLKNYPSEVDFNTLVEREFEIGNQFYAGKKDPALSWMPWIKDDDRTLEVYEALRKNAPFAKFASQLKFRIGVLYLEQGKIDEAITVFEEISEFHKNSPEEKFAIFELANIYLQKASRGDSDGHWGRKARKTLRSIIEKYPNDKEVLWARQELKTADTLNAKKAFAIADFYRKRGDEETAVRYLNDLITEYPKTEIAEKANAILSDMGRRYKEPPIKPIHPEYAEKRFPLLQMPKEKEKYLEVPSDADGKWLLPIEDLELDKTRKNTDEKILPKD